MSTSSIDPMTTQTRMNPDEYSSSVILKPEFYPHLIVVSDREFYSRRVVLWSILMEELKDTVRNHEIYTRHKTSSALATLNDSDTSSTIATSSALATLNSYTIMML